MLAVQDRQDASHAWVMATEAAMIAAGTRKGTTRQLCKGKQSLMRRRLEPGKLDAGATDGRDASGHNSFTTNLPAYVSTPCSADVLASHSLLGR